MSALQREGYRRRSAGAFRVTMESHDPEVDRVERDHDRNEAGGRDQSRPAPAPGPQAMGMQVDGVDNPGDRGPGFLWIPSPPAAPGVLAPDGPRHGAEGPDREAEQDGTEGQPVEGFQRWQPRGNARAVQPGFDARAAVFDEIERREDKARDQDAGGRHHAGDVDLQPVALQRRHERLR